MISKHLSPLPSSLISTAKLKTVFFLSPGKPWMKTQHRMRLHGELPDIPWMTPWQIYVAWLIDNTQFLCQMHPSKASIKNSFQMHLLIIFGGGVYRRQLVLDKAVNVEWVPGGQERLKVVYPALLPFTVLWPSKTVAWHYCGSLSGICTLTSVSEREEMSLGEMKPG